MLHQRETGDTIVCFDHRVICYVPLGSYSDGPTLAEIGLTQPARGSAESILQQTAAEKPNLRVGDVDVVRESTAT